MNRRFIIPAAIALTAHALLFVGSGKPPTRETKRLVLLDQSDPPPVIVVVDDPPPPVSPDDEDSGGDKSDIEPPPSIIEAPPHVIDTGATMTQPYVPAKSGTATALTPFNVGRPAGAGTGKKLFSPDLLDEKPRTRFQREPAYPFALKTAGVTGTVWVEFMVDENGRVHDVRVVKSTNSGFNDATLNAVSQWRFEPGKHHGLPVRFRMSIPIIFNLND